MPQPRFMLPAAVLLAVCAGCATFRAPGGPARLATVGTVADSADGDASPPAPHLPASFALARVQAPDYASDHAPGSAWRAPDFSVVPITPLLEPERLSAVTKWQAVQGAVVVEPGSLPGSSGADDGLRLAAAKLQAGVLLVCTLDTSFRVAGHVYGPAEAIPLGASARTGGDSTITATASAVFVDVRTGIPFGTASATQTDPAEGWSSAAAISEKRLDIERRVFARLMTNAESGWSDIAKRYR